MSSWRTSGLILALRRTGRALGLNRWIATALYGRAYEARYDNDFAACIRLGDCVWDIGANIGYYTELFSNRVGSEGAVFAFEPSHLNFCRLIERCSTRPNVQMYQIGLGAADGRLNFIQGEDSLGATSRVEETGNSGDVVNIRSGDSLIEEGLANAPNVLKIDVEGFEWEVLGGLKGLLKQDQVRAIGIEVHFSILENQDKGDVPRKIEELLSNAGFSISWPDASHVLAVR